MVTGAARAAPSAWLAGYRAARVRFPPRPAAADWPATRHGRDQVQVLMGGGPAGRHHGGQAQLLDWLEGQDGGSWQQRWLASGAEQAGTSWWQLPARWPGGRDIPGMRRHGALAAALIAMITADVVRPSLAWLAAGGCRHADLARAMAAGRDSQTLARLRAVCDSDPGVAASAAARNHAVQRAAVVMAAKGGGLTDITLGDFLELLDTEADVHGAVRADSAACYRALRATGIFGPPRRAGCASCGLLASARPRS